MSAGERAASSRERPFRSGLTGKLFAGALAAALPPLAIALVSSVAVHLAQAKLVGAEVVREKAASARLLLEERMDRLLRFTETTSRQNSLVVNLDLGLDQALERYLAGLAGAEGLSRLRVVPAETAPHPESSAVRQDFAVAAAIEQGPAGPELIVRRTLRTSLGRTLGILESGLPLSLIAGRIAGELGVSVLVLEEDLRVLLTESPDSPVGQKPPAPNLPLYWAAWAGAGTYDELPPSSGRLFGEEMLYGASAASLAGLRCWIAVAYPTAELNRAYRRGIAALAAAGAAALALAALVTIYFIRTIARPASSLAVTARRIAEGRYGLTSGIRLDDEVGDIARELDFLSHTLAAQKEQRDVAEEALRQSELQFRSIFDSVDDAIMVHDTDSGIILDANAACGALFGLSKSELLDQLPDRIASGAEGYGADRFLTLLHRAAGGEIIREEWRSSHSGGRIFWTELVLRPARIGGANRVLATYRDIDARKMVEEEQSRSLKEKETLLREVHHRVKNNFQIINSLFSLQESVNADENLAAALREPRARIQAMAMVHDRLYRSVDLDAVDFGSYVEDLAEQLYAAYVSDPEQAVLELQAEALVLHIDRAIPCGLILNELLTNALKYAFPPALGRCGCLTVSFRREEGEAVLVVEDDGIGIPEDLDPRASLGLILVEALTQQLAGRFSIDGSSGTRAELRFPLPA